jgi:hypothetical protein
MNQEPGTEEAVVKLPKLETVEITLDRTKSRPGFVVTPVWSGVDRPRSYSVFTLKMSLANRLKNAIEAGVAITVRGTGTDVNGETYADTQNHFLGSRLNADLKKLGF